MSGVRKRSVSIQGHRTSFSVEDEFYSELEALSRQSGRSMAALIAEIDNNRPTEANLSSAIRLHVLRSLKARGGKDEKQD